MSQPSINPYESPSSEAARVTEEGSSLRQTALPGLIGTAGPARLVACGIDYLAAGAVLYCTVGLFSRDSNTPLWATALGIILVFSYYFFTEWLLGATLGKFLGRLRVRQIYGSRCTAAQIATRTLLRVVEGNPLFLGGLPAIVVILSTPRRQRIGDWAADTVVVTTKRLKQFQAAS